jgi:hypothetical protein
VNPFSLAGRLGRRAYAATFLGAFLSQHVVVLLVLATWGEVPILPWWFWFSPLRALVLAPQASEYGLLGGLVMAGGVAWILVAASVRRARDSDFSLSLAALAMAPGLQLIVFVWLTAMPASPRANAAPRTVGVDMPAIGLGIAVGAGSCLVAIVANALWLGIYGWSLFLASPFLIGLATAAIANHRRDVGVGSSLWAVTIAMALGGFLMGAFALEGLFCLLLASPLALFLGWLGALVGRDFANAGRRARGTMTSVALVPLLVIAEVLLPPRAAFDSVESVEVAAPPAAVWDAVVHMGPIPDPPAPPFRWGLAYPMRGQIYGQGVGAIREGVFSTGVAYERVTEWEPNRKLSFIVLSDPPTMKELSPYEHVNAPHVNGYFRTLDARFTITPLANGHTRLSLATRHELDLEPALYWMPFAEWATHANKVRVLAHFRQQAEATAARAGAR